MGFKYDWELLNAPVKESKQWSGTQVQQMLVEGFIHRAMYAIEQVRNGSSDEQEALEVMLHSCMVLFDGNASDMCGIGITRPEAWREIEALVPTIDPKAQLIIGAWTDMLVDYQNWTMSQVKYGKAEPVFLNSAKFEAFAKENHLASLVQVIKNQKEPNEFGVSSAWSGGLALGLALALQETKKQHHPIDGVRVGVGILAYYLAAMCDGQYGFDPVVTYTIGHPDDEQYQKKRNENWFASLDEDVNPLGYFDFGGSLGRSIVLWGVRGPAYKHAKEAMFALQEAKTIEQDLGKKQKGSQKVKGPKTI